MELNVSSFFDADEAAAKQLNSTALEQDADDRVKENEQKEWKLSPIVAEENRSKTSIFRRSQENKGVFKTPLRIVNEPCTSSTSMAGESKNSGENSTQETKLSMSADLSSFITNNSLNPFDSILNSLHKSINFSPSVVFSQESSSSSQKEKSDGEKFQWSVEQLAILKPAHISEDEIAACYQSPNPEIEEKIQEALNVYWSENVSYIPSPDGPRYVHLPHRDGKMTTIRYGSDGASCSTIGGGTPSLCDIIRKKEAVKAAYATSSPKQRPRRNLRQARNRNCQTELTIPPNVDLDLNKILGAAFQYQKPEEGEDDDEEVFDVSVSSNFSTRRRLFSSGAREDEVEGGEGAEEANMSVDEQMLNESQPFNDSLSPVRRNEDVTDEVEEEQESHATSAATRSHVSQIAINISILNDCMMHSMDQDDVEKEEETSPGPVVHDEEGMQFPVDHLHANEYEMLDRSSSSSNATPRHEDLDWTPRRIGSISVSGSSGPSTAAAAGLRPAHNQPDFRRFMFDMSPIHPNHGSAMGTPIQRCHLNLNMPRGFSIDDDCEEGEEEEEEGEH